MDKINKNFTPCSCVNSTCYHENNQQQCQQIIKSSGYLSDYSKKDKIWDVHKYENDQVTDIFMRFAELSGSERFRKWAERTGACSQWLDFAWSDPDLKTGEILLKLFQADFCRVRTCPICSWRRSLKHKARLLERLPEIEKKYPKSRWLYLTLTVRNCEIEELRDTIRAMNKGFIRMKSQKCWKALGWIKNIEVTRGKDDSSMPNSAHPHFHILLHMPNSYFKNHYIKHDEWVLIWQKCMKLDYEPDVDIRAVRANAKKGKTSMVAVVSEMAKYSTKPKTFINHPEWFIEYANQVHRMRFVDSGGSLKGILSDDYDDLIKINEDEEAGEKDADVRFNWHREIKHYLKQ